MIIVLFLKGVGEHDDPASGQLWPGCHLLLSTAPASWDLIIIFVFALLAKLLLSWLQHYDHNHDFIIPIITITIMMITATSRPRGSAGSSWKGVGRVRGCRVEIIFIILSLSCYHDFYRDHWNFIFIIIIVISSLPSHWIPPAGIILWSMATTWTALTLQLELPWWEHLGWCHWYWWWPWWWPWPWWWWCWPWWWRYQGAFLQLPQRTCQLHRAHSHASPLPKVVIMILESWSKSFVQYDHHHDHFNHQTGGGFSNQLLPPSPP